MKNKTYKVLFLQGIIILFFSVFYNSRIVLGQNSSLFEINNTNDRNMLATHLSMWSEYNGVVFIAISIIILQFCLLFGFIIQQQLRKKAEKKLLESNEQFQNLFEFAPYAICVIDLELNLFIDANKKAEVLFGCSKERLMHFGLLHFYESEQPDSLHPAKNFQLYKEQVLSDREVVFERVIKNLKGEKHICEIHIVKIPLANKKIIRASFIDITERNTLIEQLHQNEKMEAIGQLAGGIAHDFNNQLAIILGYTEIIESKIQDEKVKVLIGNIKKASSRSAELIKNLLAFSRKGNLIAAQIDINNMVEEVITLFHHTVDKKITVKKELDANLLLAFGDVTQLQSGLLNLVLNAKDAMANGGEIVIKTAMVTLAQKTLELDIPPGKYIQLSVADNGCGMSETIKKRIFLPFFTTKEQGKGTGLGLPAVYGMMKSHHGAITVSSTPLQGSTFTLYFPLFEDKNMLEKTLIAKNNTQEKGCVQILVAEDEEMLSDIFKEVLQNAGYKVTTVANGQEAVSYYQTYWRQCDLVILDMIMPHMGGKEAFIAMRKINPKIKALLASGYSLCGEAQSIIDEGALGFIQKPFQNVELTQKVSAILKL